MNFDSSNASPRFPLSFPNELEGAPPSPSIFEVPNENYHNTFFFSETNSPSLSSPSLSLPSLSSPSVKETNSNSSNLLTPFESLKSVEETVSILQSMVHKEPLIN